MNYILFYIYIYLTFEILYNNIEFMIYSKLKITQ